MYITKLLAVLGASLAIASPVRQHAVQRAELEGKEASSHFEVRSGANPTVPGPGALSVGWITPGTEAFKDISVYHHNVHRANHSAPAAVWNHTLYKWAQAKALTCQFNEDGMPGWDDVGMNIAGGTYGYPVEKPNPSAMISGLWYNSEVMNYPQYGVGNPNYNNFENWGHFSQVVWPSSTEIGCGLASCGNGWFGVCLYSPPGNWDGEFNSIGRPKGYPIVYPNGQTTM